VPDRAVDEELERDKMLMEPAPFAWREAELAYLMKALGLEERITAFPVPAAPPSANGGGQTGEAGN